MADTLETYYASGAPYLSPSLLRGAQQILLGAALCVSILFLGNFIRMWVVGKRPNPVKLALLGTSIAFWWYCNNGVTNILAGIALFEVFHDVQYLSLVWIYNRTRVEKDPSIRGFMRFVFRRSGSLIGLYIGLVFAYGSLGYFKETEIETIKRFLTGVVAASGLLHFYYDGFIWKVRESSTRQSLGLSGGTTEIAPRGIFQGWLLHGAKWATAFVVPLGALWLAQVHSSVPALQRTAWVVKDLPVGARQHYEYAKSLQHDGQLDAAAREFDTALSFDPKYAGAHYALALLRQSQSKFDAAAEQYEAALPLDPRNPDLRYDYSYTLERLGRGEEAARQIAAALDVNPNFPRALYRRSFYSRAQGKLDDAISDLRKAVEKEPTFIEARFALAQALLAHGDFESARSEFETVVKEAPGRADAVNGLGITFLRQGQTSQAILRASRSPPRRSCPRGAAVPREARRRRPWLRGADSRAPCRRPRTACPRSPRRAP
jgi:Tfp pilus assembly protein PilF